MYLETRKVKDIHPYPGNPRINKDAVQPVMESIQKDGYRARIMVDANGVIIAGHTRFAAIKRLGWKEVEVWVADDMTDEQVRDYRIRDNYTAGFAEWDFDQLEREIQGLDFDMSDFGIEPEGEPDDDDDYRYGGRDDEEVSRLTHNVFENFEHPYEPTYIGKYDIPVMQPTQTTGEKLSAVLRLARDRQLRGLHRPFLLRRFQVHQRMARPRLLRREVAVVQSRCRP